MLVGLVSSAALSGAAGAAPLAQGSGTSVDYEAGLLDDDALTAIPAFSGSEVNPKVIETLAPGPMGRICNATFSGVDGVYRGYAISEPTGGAGELSQAVFGTGGKAGSKRMLRLVTAASEICPPTVSIGQLQATTASPQPKVKKAGSSKPIAYRGTATITSSQGGRASINVAQLLVVEGELGSFTSVITGAANPLDDADFRALATATSKQLRAAAKASGKAEPKR